MLNRLSCVPSCSRTIRVSHNACSTKSYSIFHILLTSSYSYVLTVPNRARCARVRCTRTGIITNNDIGILLQLCIIMCCILPSGRKWGVGGGEGVTFLLCWLLVSHCQYHSCIQELVMQTCVVCK